MPVPGAANNSRPSVSVAVGVGESTGEGEGVWRRVAATAVGSAVSGEEGGEGALALVSVSKRVPQVRVASSRERPRREVVEGLGGMDGQSLSNLYTDGIVSFPDA